jgi:ribosome-binding factor A
MKEQDGKVLAKNLISSVRDPNIEQSMIEFVTHFTMDKQFEAKARCSKALLNSRGDRVS